MGIQAEETEVERVVSFLFEIGYGVGVAEALAHLAVVYEHEFAVHPEAHALFAGKHFVLRYFVLVVYRNVVHAAGVYVEALSEIFAAHRRTFDMPAGITFAPGAVPLHYVQRIGFFPQREVGGMTLLVVHFDARARELLFDVCAAQAPVPREFRNVEIYAV